MNDLQVAPSFASGDYANRGFRYAEAAQCIEFCIEFNCQEDRLQHSSNALFLPLIDARQWNPVPIYDSRQQVARDVMAFNGGLIGDDSPWARLYRDILDSALHGPPPGWSVESFARDPRYNGFGPGRVAWALYEGRGDYTGAFAIAIRGTVSSSQPGALRDFVVQPVRASHFLNEYVSFASTEDAAVHGGFAHDSFSLLLDGRYGILRVLSDLHIPRYTRLFITGHSQGAAMATLVHAFLHYSMLFAATRDVFALADSHYRLKSYAFGQPKPGNARFATDFAGITQRFDNAIVINNVLDVIPQLPLTLQDLEDVPGVPHGESWMMWGLQHLAGFSSGIHGLVGKMAEPLVRRHVHDFGQYFNCPAIGRIGSEISAHSWNFQPAGHVLFVFGRPGDEVDPFLQHHAWMYRGLLHEQMR